MNDQKFDINSLRIASPCSVGWENMTGDDRARHCDLCCLNVYNISELTTREVENLIQAREGRLCIRMYRRADGTILTRDCPAGLRAIQKRVARFAGATLAAILGFFSISYSQEKDAGNAKVPEVVREKIKDIDQRIELLGTVSDDQGAVIPGVPIRLIRVGDKKIINATGNADGEFHFKDFPKGVYELEIDAALGFEKLSYKNLNINGSERIKITLSAGTLGEWVGLLVEDGPLIEMNPTPVTTEILARKPEKLRTK